MFSLLHTFHPLPTFVAIGTLRIGWYGVWIAVGLVAGFLVVRKIAQSHALKVDVVGVFLNTFVVSFIGARLYHVLNEFPYYLDHPGEIIAVWHGGLALHGGIIAGFLYLLWYAKKNKHSIWALTDLLAPGLVLGQAIGRWGNYFNQELYGKPTSLPWGIPIDTGNRLPGFVQYTFFHPTFLYESLWNLIIFGVIWMLWQERGQRKRSRSENGMITCVYLLLYSLGRGLFELVRIDATPILAGVRLPIIMSTLLCAAAVIGIVRLRQGKRLPWSR